MPGSEVYGEKRISVEVSWNVLVLGCLTGLVAGLLIDTWSIVMQISKNFIFNGMSPLWPN